MRWPVHLLLGAVFFLGLAHVALLPPFEGFDETAHYSSIVQIADTGRLPRLGEAWIAQEVKDYAESGPMPYSVLPTTHASRTYADALQAHGLKPSPPYAPSDQPNWQAQHPPLYYLLLAPVATATRDMPLQSRLFWLRQATFLIAFAALCLAASINGRWFKGGDWATAAWPLLLANWFPELARLGNDSLAALWLTLAWGALLAARRSDSGRGPRLMLGLAFGLGILTKAYVVPIALVCLGYLAIETAWRRKPLGPLLCALVPTMLLGGGWHLWMAWHGTGLTQDSMTLAQQGGLMAGLAQYWSLSGWLRSLASIVKSFFWSGSWSFARPPSVFYLPYLALLLAVCSGWIFRARQGDANAFLPLLFLLPLFAGLMMHSLLWLALGQVSVTGGWYLHVLMAPLALLATASLSVMQEWRGARQLIVVLMGCALTFGAGMAWMQIGVFAGCVFLQSGGGTIAAVDWSCLLDPGLLHQRLGLLASPALGFSALAIGILFAGAALAAWKRSRA